MGALGLVFALLGAAMLGGFGWELGRCAARWLLGRRAGVTILLPVPRHAWESAKSSERWK